MVTVSHEPWMIQTAIPHIYEDLVDVKKLFHTQYNLFVAGLVYGLLLDIRSDGKPHADIVRINSISSDTVKNIIDMAYLMLDNGRNDRDIKAQLLRVADGGVTALNSIYYKTGDLDVKRLVAEAERVWPTRIGQLHNV